MRIIVADPGFDYSTLAVAESYTRAFERLGFEVSEYATNIAFRESLKLQRFQCPDCKNIYTNPTKYSWHQITEYISSPILNWVIQEKVDIFIAIHGYHINSAVVDNLRRLGCLTAVVLTDEPQQVDRSRDWSRYYDFVFCNDRNVLKNHKNSYYLPVAADDGIFEPKKVKKKYKSDILFGGSFYRERFEFLDDPDLTLCLKEYNTKFVGSRRSNFKDGDIKNKFFQDSIENSKISYEEMSNYVAGSKVCLDMPRDEFRDGIFGRVNTKRIKASCLSPRIFECALAGSIAFTSGDRSDIFDLFPDDLIPIYYDHVHLIELIEEFLNDKKKRKKLSKEQRSYVLENHTYIHRTKEIVKIMGLKTARTISNYKTHNRLVIKSYEREWRKNSEVFEKNDYYKIENTLGDFENRFEGKRCSIISNGPSIEKGYVTSGINFYLNEAIKVFDLTENDFAVIIHPAKDVYDRCVKDYEPVCPLLCSTVVNYDVVGHWAKKKKSIHFFHTYLGEENSIKTELRKRYSYPVLSPGATVAYSAITCAIYMGFKEVHISGVDCCYMNMKKYAYRKTKYDDFRKTDFKMMEGANGDPVMTDDIMLISRTSLLELIAETQDVRFHIYGGGLLFSDQIENLIVHGRC